MAIAANDDDNDDSKRTADKSADKSLDKSADKSLDKSADKSLDKSADKSLDKSADKSLDESSSGGGGWWRATGLASRARFVLGHCTVEPVFGCYVLTSVLTGMCSQNLSLQKACRVNLRLDDGTCAALERRDATAAGYVDAEVAVQRLVAGMMMWKTTVLCSVPAALIVFIGSWSDRHRRRKPCMLAPVAGELVSSAGMLLCAYYYHELPMEAVGLAESVPTALSGGWMLMAMAVFSYIGDVSTTKYRTLRIGILNVCQSVAVPIGTALSGIMYQRLGFYGVYSTVMVLYSLIIAYGVIFIEEIKPETSKETAEPPKAKANMAASCLYSIEDFFNPSHIKEAVWVTFKRGQHKRRTRIISLMVILIVVMGPLYGEMVLVYLFTRVQFNWDEIEFSVFSTYSMITNLIGTMLSVGVFSHILKIDDALIGVMSCISKILAGFVYAFASTDFIFYLGPLVEIINGTSFIAMRSIISKLVPSNELGKVNSIFGVCEALVPLIYVPMYSAVYTATVKTFAGAFFILGSILTIPAVIIFLWMYYETKKEERTLQVTAINSQKSEF